MDTSTLIDQIQQEAEALGVSMADGFELSDMVSIIEAVAKVLHSSQELWSGLSGEERKKAVVDMILALDDQYMFSDKIAETFVAWDIPYLPDAIVDVVLNKTSSKLLIRSFYSILVDSVFKRLDRKSAAIGIKAWEPVSKGV